MAFRDRVKRVLGRKSSSNSSSTSSVKKTSSGRRDSSVWYQPGEKLPPLKYRRPVTKEHKELLDSFSFQKAWRRRSDTSQYSPMGSRLPSRRNSRKSTTAPAPARRTQHELIEDVSEDQDLANVGLSPQPLPRLRHAQHVFPPCHHLAYLEPFLASHHASRPALSAFVHVEDGVGPFLSPGALHIIAVVTSPVSFVLA
ncbi:uncharacterized protein J3D65DRAFT_441962 [Phyllosticta citribraziliensis]|uniref:Uncharacterized protein n=1 Tax=Phyllosticta citribraziliensis TaxID=989973 RepID=A0ABR1LIU9_9PEZI